MKRELENYFKAHYSNDIILKDFEDRNYTFDTVLSDRNINIFVEYKQRYFTTGKNDIYLKEYDILIELIQTLPYFQKNILKEINNCNVSKVFNAYDLNIAVGWFYKCSADRLVYFRWLDDSIFDIIDIDFKLFKQWFMNNITTFELQFSNKTTNTINAKVKLKDIPKSFLTYTRGDKQ